MALTTEVSSERPVPFSCSGQCHLVVEFNISRLHYMLWVVQEGGQCMGGNRHRVGMTVDSSPLSMGADATFHRLLSASAYLARADDSLHALEREA